MTTKTPQFLQFTGDEKINDILTLHPEAAEILYTHGIGCAGCVLGHTETLKQGMQGHGFDQEDLKRVLTDLNQAAEDLGLQK
jgi:hydroxylamine reductase